MGDLLICNSTLSKEQLGDVKLFEEYPNGLLLFAVICCISFMMVGIPGNFITIVALVRYKKIQNATTAFIINLACSDMLFCCFNLPMISMTYWHRAWPYSMTECRMLPMAGYGLVAVSLLTILAIMVNRYILITYPRQYSKIYRTRYIAIMIASTWISSFGILLPTWFGKWGRFGMDSIIGSCSILPDCNNRSPKKFLFIGAFLLPCFLVLVCYLRIFCIVRNSVQRSSRVPSQRRCQRKREASTVLADSLPSPNFPDSNVKAEHSIFPQNNLLTPPLSNLQPESPSLPEVCLYTTDANIPANKDMGMRCENAIMKRLRQSFVIINRRRQVTNVIRHSTKDKKVLQMITTIIVSFWVCYLPITFIKLFREFSVPPVPRVLGYVLVYLTTCINPIIYVVMSSEYRQAYKGLFTCDEELVISRPVTINSKSRKMPVAVTQESKRSYAISTV